MNNLSEILDRLQSVVNDRFDTQKEAGEFLKEECNFSFSAPTVAAKIRGEQTMRLSEVLCIADSLNINYRWLFTGSRGGWEDCPSERITVLDWRTRSPIFSFDVPMDFPVNLAYYPEGTPEAFNPIVKREGQDA